MLDAFQSFRKFFKPDPKLLTIIVGVLIFFSVSIPGLFVDVINPDAINWHNRSLDFADGLMSGEFSKTYQSYHPGITLMWVTGPALRAVDRYYISQGYESYAKESFLYLDFTAKLCLVFFSSVLFFLTLWTLKEIFDIRFLLILITLAAFEPYFLGERRLYHLDFIMGMALLTSFSALFRFFYFKNELRYLVLGVLMFVLAFLTKSTALVFTPILPLMLIFSKSPVLKKLLYLLLMIISLVLFSYVLFPAVWRNPVKNIPVYSQKIFSGVSDIGYEGRKERGNSGEGDNVMLKSTFAPKEPVFYLKVLGFQMSPAAVALAVMSVIFMFFACGRYIFLFVKALYKYLSKKEPFPDTLKDPKLWIGLLAFGIAFAFFTALTLSTKKIERYTIVMFPFIFVMISSVFSRMSSKSFGVLISIFIFGLIPQYVNIYPYFYAYSNPLFGGEAMKYASMNSDTFGVATYEVYKAIAQDITPGDKDVIITGNKTLKAVSSGVRFTRTPNCFTNYYAAFAFDPQPNIFCPKGGRFKLIKTIKVGYMDYWYIYKNMDPQENLLQRYLDSV